MNPIRERSRTTDVEPPPLATDGEIARPAHGPVRDKGQASPFALLMRTFSREADRGESTVHRVLSAAAGSVPLDPTSLLALQAGIYRYGETMDLAARLVDKASSGVKSVLQGP